MNARTLFSLTLTATLFFLVPATASLAEDFRIETQVFLEDETEPISENVTFFKSGVVYDFLTDPKQIAIFRMKNAEESGTLILLDPKRQLRTDLTTEELLLYSRGLQDWATTQKDPLLKFSANPDFQETFDEREGTLSLTHDRMRYHLLTQTCSENTSVQYKEFSDWYVRVAARMHQGASLPFPRLMVNAALARHQVIPREVHLEVPSSNGHPALNVRSKHEVLLRLSQNDRHEIEKAQQYLAVFKKVDFKEFEADLFSASNK